MNIEFNPEEMKLLKQNLAEIPFKYVIGILQFLEHKEKLAADAGKVKEVKPAKS